jgi:hypothetical protein
MHTKLKKSTLFFVCCFLTLGLSAQINLSPNKAKDLLKDKKNEKPTTEKPTEKPSVNTSKPPSQTEKPASGSPAGEKPIEEKKQAAQTNNARPSRSAGAAISTVDLDFSSAAFAPSIVWASLLSEGSWYFNITTGDLKLPSLSAAFLPQKTTSGEPVSYRSYDNPTPVIRMDVVDMNTNTVLGSLHYSGKEDVLPFYELEMLEGSGYKYSVKVVEGSYELRFHAGNKQFYTFPFNVEKKTNPDPYSSVKDFYFLHGPWEQWGRVEFGPDGHFIFNFYLNHETTTIPNSARWDVNKPCKNLVKLYRDGKMVAVHRLQHVENQFEESDIQLSNGVWKRYDVTLHQYPPAAKGQGAGSRPFFLKDNMKDGSYKVEVLLKDQAGQEITLQYSFTVKGGAIVPDPKADRAQNNDPLQFLEQGPGRFYVRKN